MAHRHFGRQVVMLSTRVSYQDHGYPRWPNARGHPDRYIIINMGISLLPVSIRSNATQVWAATSPTGAVLWTVKCHSGSISWVESKARPVQPGRWSDNHEEMVKKWSFYSGGCIVYIYIFGYSLQYVYIVCLWFLEMFMVVYSSYTWLILPSLW